MILNCGLVDLEKPTEPHDEDKNEPGITVGEAETTLRLATFTRVEGEPENEELTLGYPADSLKSLAPASLDLLELGDMHRVWPLRPVSTIAGLRYEPDVADHSDTLDFDAPSSIPTASDWLPASLACP